MKNTIKIAVLLSSLLYAPTLEYNATYHPNAVQRNAIRTQITQKSNALKEKFPEKDFTNIDLQHRTTVQNSLTHLVVEEHYTVLRSAKWCTPCKLLKEDAHEKGLRIDATIMDDTLEETTYTEQSYADAGIRLDPSLPLLLINQNGAITSYNSYHPTTKEMINTTTGSSVALEKILKKKKMIDSNNPR